ncbi:Adenylyltransferase and sulfurtransferase MOCS3 [Trichostrongylus colubriformis]|uniref:Adenylyltransferase and sulfurtransferase MOCS3 n=1 Tax=Trichostrongylus colubriformis TaxID=6319 RepID=A0AAN8FNT5_TRICO
MLQMIQMTTNHSLSKEQIARYSRQLLIQDFGVQGQQGVSSANVVIVGAGGLGCPVAMYLAGAGIHTIGIVDYDEVATDNLHRQVAHKESMIGKPKVESLKQSMNELNSNVNVVLHNILLDSDCALDILKPYDIVVDCSDNPATSALRWEGQLTVFNYIDDNGERSPCYRCIFPVPANPAHVTNCSEGGVLGPVVGVIGSLQALEVLKIAAGLAPNYASKLYLFDGSCGRSRTIQLRHRNKQCDVCGDKPTITELIDYAAFCGSGACDKIQNLSVLSPDDRVSVTEYANIRASGSPILLDTRPPHEFAIASLDEAKNITLDEVRQLDTASINERLGLTSAGDHPEEVFVICHRGNDSQLAVEILKKKLHSLRIRDVRGGYEAWANEVDNDFPRY